jgi:hypothetical protein
VPSDSRRISGFCPPRMISDDKARSTCDSTCVTKASWSWSLQGVRSPNECRIQRLSSVSADFQATLPSVP